MKSKPEMIVNDETTELTKIKIKAQRTIFFLIAIVSFFHTLKWHHFIYCAIIWHLMVLLLNNPSSKYVKVSKTK